MPDATREDTGTMQQPPTDSSDPKFRAIASPQDFAGGLMLLALGVAGFIGSWDLAFGQISGIGSGMLPKIVAGLICVCGVLLIGLGFRARNGELLTPWNLRGLFFVLGAALLFAWTIRPLGLICAAPIAILFASLADPETRPIEIIVFAVVMTAFCIGLFSFGLGLPIPVLPSALPYPLTLFLAGGPL